MLKVHSQSTGRVYLSQWRLFESWCHKRGADPLQATSVLVCDFLLYLFKDRNISARSITGYKSALTYFLKRASGYDLSTCTVAADLIRSFKRERPLAPKPEVKWNISVVLTYLQGPLFNPDVVTVRNLTLKALFLVCLAAGRRRSEIHALERSSVCFAPDGLAVSLKPHPQFMSKTHISSKGVGALHTITIPALPDIEGTPFSLCPVRVLKHYLMISDPLRSPGQRRLFVSFDKSVCRDIAPSTLSGYVKVLICEAHKSVEAASDEEIAARYHVKAHQVRHVAHSLSQLGTMPLTEIIKTGGWTSPSTFIDHYLQHLPAESVTQLQQLGSFVAIESVFTHRPAVEF